ncbi:MAG TPA: hypothetical protein VHH73_18170 [Verrucomicrobiae bacterium]|nr:hypothetical protein [Verrucomicrobiae bacterium]
MKNKLADRWMLAMLVLVLALFTGGCSSFHKEWRTAAKQPTPADEMTGRWQGMWHSDENGHQGKLKCVVSRVDDTHYRATYYATYKSILHFGYTASLQVEKKGTEFVFKGDADLGSLAGGVYTYEGRANPTNFFSTYSSKYDHGTYQLKRPSP